jgi:hypothetical protein
VHDRSGVSAAEAQRLGPAWVLFAAVVACQIAYPLVGGTTRDRLTVATVLVTLATVVVHAVPRFGVPVAGALFTVVLVAAGAIEILGVHTGVPFGRYDYGDGLGPALGGVPVVIPAAWAMTAYPALLVGRDLPMGDRAHGRLGAGELGRLPRPPDGRGGVLALGGPEPGAPGFPRRAADELRRLAGRLRPADGAARPPHAGSPRP